MSTPPQTNVTTPESQVGMGTGTAAGAGAGGEPGAMNQMGGRKRTDWMIHVKNVQRANKGLNLMKVLKLAAKTYKKKPASKKSARKTRRGGGMVLQPAVAGGRRRRGTRKGTRRGGFDY
jgi:hypothetical protein